MGLINKIIFATFFPDCEDIHLCKDVGMIPYILHREFGYNSYLICFKNGEYPSLKTEVPGLKLLFMKSRNYFIKSINPVCNKIIYERLRLLYTVMTSFRTILTYGKLIDILQLYHLKAESAIVGLVYKVINKKGLLYLKLDMGVREFKKLKKSLKHSFFRALIKIILSLFDVITVETRSVYISLKKEPTFAAVSNNIYYLPNGVDVNKLSYLTKDFDEKENIILHVGRIGSYQKGSEIILKAFMKVSKEFPNWKLILIGPVEKRLLETFNSLSKKFL
jgi:glycosyltransferase involved in cell wall biosynthesis